MEKGALLNVLLIFLISNTLIECLETLTCNNDSRLKFDCHPDNANTDAELQKNCIQRGCCYKPPKSGTDEPSCFYPSNFNSYRMQSKSCTSTGCTFMIERAPE